MKLTDFDYQIPADRIAQYPLAERDSSKLLVLHRHTGRFEHKKFSSIADYLHAGDVLVLNDTRVMPVRLRGVKPSGGKAEITLLKELETNTWEAFTKGVNEGTVVLPDEITAQVSRLNGTLAKVTFNFQRGAGDVKEVLHDIGVMPLPVYIKREAAGSDNTQYQTVYAKKDGAVAAPTAGLHFTDRLLNRIREKGVEVHTITLHVGHGTFKPVTSALIREHIMDEETYEIPESAAAAVNSAGKDGRPVIAVGTTVTRALESAVSGITSDNIRPGRGKTSIFIYPGHRFRIIDSLITNFHLPRSTPLMLASAFAGQDLLMRAYSEAQGMGYRFYSYGDAMLILQDTGKRAHD